jgi:DNA-binding MarR family transcriptional regulator
MQRFETKFDLLNKAYNDETLKKGTIALFQYLVYKSNKEQCFPSVDTIAVALNVCKRTVQYNMRKLEKAGYIIRKDRWYNHQQLTNQYVFNLGVTEETKAAQCCFKQNKEEVESCFKQDIDRENANKNGEYQNNSQSEISKTAELLKIYKMPLSCREKLLLIYLFHRANKKGIVYDAPEAYMNAIGVGYTTFVKLLKMLRAKELIKVKYISVSGKKLLLVKLTCKDWQKDKEVSSSSMQEVFSYQEVFPEDKPVQNSQKVVSDPPERIMKNLHHINSLVWKKVLKKCRQTIQSGIRKVRMILRI